MHEPDDTEPGRKTAGTVDMIAIGMLQSVHRHPDVFEYQPRLTPAGE